MKKDRTLIETIDEQSVIVKKRVYSLASGTYGAMVVLGVFAALFVERNTGKAFAGALLVVPCMIAFVASRMGRLKLAGYVFSYGGSLCLYIGVYFDPSPTLNLTLIVLILLLVVAGFMLNPRAAVLLGVVDGVFITHFSVSRALSTGHLESLSLLGAQISLLAIAVAIVVVIARNAESLRSLLRNKLTEIEGTMPSLEESGQQVATAAGEMLAVARQQNEAAIRQSSAVKETQEILISNVAVSRQIVESARSVFENAQRTSANTEIATRHLTVLIGLSTKVSGVLDTLRTIAKKSDLLALNAALESTRAGEAGRGFRLVSEQMRQLTELITSHLLNIKGLTQEIREATETAQRSMNETIDQVRLTTDAGQQISLVAQQQENSTAQIATAMDDIAEITTQTMEASHQSLDSIKDLEQISKRLPQMLLGLVSA